MYWTYRTTQPPSGFYKLMNMRYHPLYEAPHSFASCKPGQQTTLMRSSGMHSFGKMDQPELGLPCKSLWYFELLMMVQYYLASRHACAPWTFYCLTAPHGVEFIHAHNLTSFWSLWMLTSLWAQKSVDQSCQVNAVINKSQLNHCVCSPWWLYRSCLPQ